MVINGKIIRVRALKRKNYGRQGIALIFDTELGELIRTYNSPNHESEKSKLILVLKKFMVKIPSNLFDKPNLFSAAIEKGLKDIECNLLISKSGNINYPYDILEIHPILTVNSQYLTPENQESLSKQAIQ